MQQLDAGLHGQRSAVLQEEPQQRRGGKIIQPHQRDAQGPDHPEPRGKALADAPGLFCAQVLGGEVGHTVAQRGKGGGHQIVQLDGRRIARHNGGAKAVDHALNDDVAHGDAALLQHTGDGHPCQPAQHGPGKGPALLLRRKPPQPAKHHPDRQHAAGALTEKGGPGHAGHAHPEGRHEKDIHKNIAERGCRQKPEGRPAVAQCGKDARGHIVKQQEGHA